MRSIAGLALGLLFVGLGLYGAAAVTPLAFPAAFDALGATTNVMALLVMLAIAEVFAAFAGWVTARIVADHQKGHAIMMATVGLAAAVCAGAIRWGAAPSWYYALQWILLPLAATVGAAAWERSLRRGASRGVGRRVAAT